MVENQNNNQGLDTWSLYLYAMKSPVTREKYQKRLEKFFDSIGLQGKTVEQKSSVFVNMAKKEGNGWVIRNRFITAKNVPKYKTLTMRKSKTI